MGQTGGDGEIRLSGNGLTGCIPPSLYTVPIRDFNLLSLSPCPLPAKPTGLNAADGNGNAVLSWTASGDTGVTGYRYRTKPTAAWRELVCDGVVVTGILAHGLPNGRSHALELQARNVYGWSTSSDPLTVSPSAPASLRPAPTAAPPKPAGLAASGGDRSITLSWLAPGTVAHGHWTRYRYRLRPDGGTWGAWQADACTHAAADGMVLTGLDVGVTYEVRLQSRNAVGWGADYAEATATTLPAEPDGLTAAAGNGSAILSWSNTDALDVTGYRYRIGPTAVWRGLACDDVVLAGIRAHGLTNGTVHTLELQAQNVQGWGPVAKAQVTPVAPASPVPAPTAAPPKPTGVEAVGGDRRITLSWTMPGAITNGNWMWYRYRLRASGEEWGEWQVDDCTKAATRGMTLTGLAAGATYTLRLQARNAAVGWSQYAEATATTKPAEPAGLDATPEDGGAVLSWNDPGTGITGYRYRTGPAARWRTLAHDADAIAAIRVRGLTNGTLYTLELEAQNAGGWGPSATATVTPAATPSGGAATTP